MNKNPAIILSLAILSLANGSFAQTLFWDGGTANITTNGDGISQGGAGTWNTSILNWDQGSGQPHVAWASGSNAYFGGAAGTVTLGAAVTANIVTITNKGYEFTDGGDTAYTLTVNTISNTTAGGMTTPTVFTNNIVNSSTLNIWGSSGDVRFDAANSGLTGTVALNQGDLEIGDATAYNGGFGGGWNATIASNAILFIRNITTDTLVNNTFSGAGNLEIENKSGIATILNGNNTYTGSTVIAAGTLIIESISDNSPNPLGTGPLQVGANASAGIFNFQGGSAAVTTRPLIIGGNGTSILNGNGGQALTFAGPFEYGAALTAANKVLELEGISYPPGYDTLACNLSNYTTATLTLNVQSSSDWVVFGSNSFTGGVTFTGSTGTLYISNDFALGASNNGIFLTNGNGTIASTNANVTINPSRTVTVNTNVNFTTSDSNNLIVSAFITGPGQASKGSSSYTLGVVRLNCDTNNFAGNFSMGFGNMEFTSLADPGVPCSLGAGTMITNNNSTSDAIFRYVGVSNSTTHRPLVWAGTTGPLALDNTNTGTIAYLSTAPLATGSGAKTLTLQGSNTGTNTLAQVINDSGGATSLSKAGTGEWILTGANTYSGATTISGGKLLINGSISAGAVTVSAGTLGGTGAIGGPVTVTNSGTLAAGDPAAATVATLAINNSVTGYGTIFMKLNKSAASSDKLTGITTLTYGGILSLTNLAGTLTTSDSFQLFSAANYQGAFSSISPATPGPGLAWNTNSLAVNGTLGIMTAPVTASLSITSFTLSGNTLTITATNGTANGQFVLLSSTNVSLPLNQWTPLLTNTFNGGGGLTLTTNISTLTSQEYFLLSE